MLPSLQSGESLQCLSGVAFQAEEWSGPPYGNILFDLSANIQVEAK